MSGSIMALINLVRKRFDFIYKDFCFTFFCYVCLLITYMLIME